MTAGRASPSFSTRLDDIAVFKPRTEAEIERIVEETSATVL